MPEPRIEKRRHGLALVNGCCDRPHAYLRGGKVRFTSHHERAAHPIELTPDELRWLADEAEKNGGTTWRV